MKSVVVLTGPEIQQGCAREVRSRPSLAGKFIGAIHLIADPYEERGELRIRAQVVLFDTEGAARAYQMGNPKPELPPGVEVAPGALPRAGMSVGEVVEVPPPGGADPAAQEATMVVKEGGAASFTVTSADPEPTRVT